jgi:hypothetical protein
VTDEALLDAKRRVSRKFLGKAQIHGVGLSVEVPGTITVYQSAAPPADNVPDVEPAENAPADDSLSGDVQIENLEAPGTTCIHRSSAPPADDTPDAEPSENAPADDDTLAGDALIDSLRQEAAPFNIELLREGAPVVRSATPKPCTDDE